MKIKMHIGFITPEYPHNKVKHAAGIGTSVKNLVDALLKKGVKATVFVYSQKQSEVFNDNGVEIHLIKQQKYSLLGWYFHRKYIQKYINKIILKNKIDLVESPDWTGITAFMKFNIPLLIRLHGTDTYFCYLENRKLKKKNYFFEKKALKNAFSFISPTDFTAKLTAQLFNINLNKIKTIYHGINLEKFKNDEVSNFNKHSVLYIGSVIRKKGVLELAKIFNLLVEKEAKASLTVIGSDVFDVKTGNESTISLMKELMSSKAISKTIFLGKIPYADIQNYIKKSHVCVFPSFAETFGMVTVEAMAMSKVVVNSNIGWSKELIKNEENGYLIHPKSTAEYVVKISELFNNIELSLQIASNAQLSVYKKFNIYKQVDENIKYYQKIINDYSLS
ncbi:glycosyltransferase family 4 protein [Tenacibaculum aquimarinum]|uniref:glycosyltransferase family 4 protein n=1 Tax=Tenacibaculum aquimarinum TaxID=2910675 RepID=UPI001F0AF758|nr:glycosyltransferase family 4 protein [Tenacibaculum aquimarinum]MCH3884993.1 glycosyltransferase family 4 protein [Tenacibaculum aquimarinum]